MSYGEKYLAWVSRLESEPEKVFEEDPGDFTDYSAWLEAAREEIRVYRATRELLGSA